MLFQIRCKPVTTLANSMSVALENARLFDETNRLLKETEQRNAELAVINSVQEGLVAKNWICRAFMNWWEKRSVKYLMHR